MARDRPSPYGEGGAAPRKNAPEYRSAGDRPPRSLECANALIGPGMARDRPSPYGEGGGAPRKNAPAYRSAGACPPRSPDLRENRTQPNIFRVDRSMARDRPSPYGEGGAAPRKNASEYRSAGACPPRSFDLRENRPPTNAIFRADRGMARDRPSPYGEGRRFFTVARGPSDATRASERVSPASIRSAQ